MILASPDRVRVSDAPSSSRHTTPCSPLLRHPDARSRVSFHRAANAVGAFIGPCGRPHGGRVGLAVPFFVYAVPTVVFVVLAVRLREPCAGCTSAGHGPRRRGAQTEEPAPRSPRRGGSQQDRDAARHLWSLPFPPRRSSASSASLRSSTRRCSTSTSGPAASRQLPSSRRSSSG